MASAKKMLEALTSGVDQYFEMRERRLALQRETDTLKVLEEELKHRVISGLQGLELTGVFGKTHRVALDTRTVPRVVDWSKVYTYIKQHDAFELLQKRLSNPAVVERWEDSKEVPGVEHQVVFELTYSKL